MKKFSAVLFLFVSLFLSSASMAQSSNPWAGQFDLDFKNIDDEETNFVATLNIEYVNGKLVGKFVDNAASTETKMNSITENEKSLTLNFTSEYGDLYFTLQREDDENVSGSLMDSFSVSGKRIKK